MLVNLQNFDMAILTEECMYRISVVCTLLLLRLCSPL